jgi:hypothetical protein
MEVRGELRATAALAPGEVFCRCKREEDSALGGIRNFYLPLSVTLIEAEVKYYAASSVSLSVVLSFLCR